MRWPIHVMQQTSTQFEDNVSQTIQFSVRSNFNVARSLLYSLAMK